MENAELVFLPLGGAEEVGMNLNAYGYGPPADRKWLIVDIGVTFGGAAEPGVDIILPDATFLEGERDNILAIVLTHAHEDHIGAIGWLWPRLKAPIYATPFTAALVRGKLKEKGLEKVAPLHEISLQSRLKFGPFEVELITLTHSIPEPNGVAIHTPLGVVWHTGDWKIDPEPLIGAVTDDARLTALGEGGVLAMVCDSTNVFVEGTSGSEADVRAELARLIAAQPRKVALTAFASNVARIESAILAARDAGRHVCLVGRSMHKIVGAAISCGILKDLPAFLDESDAGYLPPERVLYLCTGSQGEPRAALARIAANDHRHVTLGAGDSGILTSRVIPGNEVAIGALQNRLAARGVRLITDADAGVHVSGHPCREELRQMYRWARPRIAVPVHGEQRHIHEHAAFARSLQVPIALTPKNGDMIRLAPGEPEVVDEVPAGRLFVDGERLVASSDDAFGERRRLAVEGALTVTLAVSLKRNRIVAGPDVRARGLAGADDRALEAALDAIAQAAEAAYERLTAAEIEDEDGAEEIIGRAVRKEAQRKLGKRPLVEIVLLKV
jgi:ribonuclease J